MTNGIIFLVVCVLVITVLIFSYKMFRGIRAQKHIDEMYATLPRGKGFIKRVLTEAYGHSKVVLGANIPVKSKRGNAPPATADALLVTRAGVIVISILPFPGKLDNPQGEDWRYLSQKGQVTTVENPFAKNSYMVEVLKHHLRRDGFHNISFHSLVVISNCGSVKPRFTYRNMLTENTFLDEINSIMLDRQLSFTETRDVLLSIRRHCVKHKAEQNPMADTKNDI